MSDPNNKQFNVSPTYDDGVDAAIDLISKNLTNYSFVMVSVTCLKLIRELERLRTYDAIESTNK